MDYAFNKLLRRHLDKRDRVIKALPLLIQSTRLSYLIRRIYIRYTGYPRTDPARHVQINEVKLNGKVLYQFANKHVKF